MLHVKNRFTPGNSVAILPFGIPVKLEYGEKGLLKKVSIYTNTDFKTETADSWHTLYDTFVKNKTVSLSIPLKEGTSYIYGILKPLDSVETTLSKYTDISGYLPEITVTSMLNDFYSDPQSFKFVAGTIESKATLFSTSISIRQWLIGAGFNTARDFIVSYPLNIEKILEQTRMKIDTSYPLISGYIEWDKQGQNTFYPTNLLHLHITDTHIEFDDEGRVKELVVFDDNSAISSVYLDLYYVVTNNVLVGDSLVVDSDTKEVLYHNKNAVNLLKKVDEHYNCSVCHSPILVHNTGSKCKNPHCATHTYKDALQLISTLHLPIVFNSYNEYIEACKNYINEFGSYKISDLVNWINDGNVIATDIYTVLRAAIPKRILPLDDSVQYLINQSNGSLETVTFYFRNPDRMKVDFALDIHVYGKFLTWIKDEFNCNNIIDIFSSSKISLKKQIDVLFEGEPILRKYHFCLTGRFRHGSFDDVARILQSYKAKVSTNYTTDINAVVTGGLNEEIDGRILRKAKADNVSIIGEDDLFNLYKIDEDLQKLKN